MKLSDPRPPTIIDWANGFRARLHRRLERYPYTAWKRFDDVSFRFIVAGEVAVRDYDIWPGHPNHTPRTGNTRCCMTDQLRFIRDHLVVPGDVVLEAGTEWGYTAVLIGIWIRPHGRLITFEPSTSFYPIALKNIEINGLSNVSVVNEAVGAERKIGVSFDGFHMDASSEVSKVNQCSLDSYLEEKPTFLKLDIEGFEVEALKGAQEILKTYPKLQIELHTEYLSRYNTSVDEFFSLFPAAQYDLFIQWDGDRSTVVPLNLDREKSQITKRVQIFGLPK